MNPKALTKTFVLANDFKEGDMSVGGTRDENERKEAREELASLRLGEITKVAFVEDQLTETLHRSLDSELVDELARLSVSELKRILPGPDAAVWTRRYRDGLASEGIAAAR